MKDLASQQEKQRMCRLKEQCKNSQQEQFMTEFLARRRTEAKPKPILIVRSLEPFKARAK